MRTARSEVSDRVSAVPASRAAGAAGAAAELRPQRAAATAAGVEGASAFLARSLDDLARQSGQGAPHARAAFALLSQAERSRLDAVAGQLAGVADGSVPSWSSAALYGLALAADADGRAGDAVLIFCVLAANDWGVLDGCLGLGVIATRQKRFAEARALASRCLDAETRHPRALCILGICELEAGSPASAQTYLAAAARLARTRPDLREDLQAAQRALLLMHLA